MNSTSKKKMHPIPWWRGIRERLVLFFIIFLALSIIVFNLFSIHMFKSHLFKMGREKNLALAQKITEEVEISMEVIIRDLFSVSRIWPMEGGSISDRYADLERLKDRNENIRFLSVFDLKGNKLLSLSRKEIVPVDELKDRAQEEKIESFIKGNIYFSHVYTVTQALPIVQVSVPLRSGDQSKIRGVLTAGISLKGVYKKLEAIKLYRGQDLYLVDTNGMVIAYFSHMKEQNVLNIKGLIPFLENFRDSVKLKQYMSGISERSLITPLVYKNLRQQEVLGVISICPELKWGVIVQEQVNVLLEPMIPIIKKNIFISGMIFIIVSILATLFIRFVLSPLIRFYRFTENLGAGIEGVSVKGKDEIGRIGQNMGQLLKEICRKNETLPNRYKGFEANSQRLEESYDLLEEVKEELDISQENLRKEKNFTKKLINGLDFLIVLLDLNGKVLICNKSCEKKTGYNYEDMMGKDWFETVYPPDKKYVAIECFHKIVKGDAQGIIEDYILTKDKNFLNIQWYSNIINDSKGMAEGVILVGEDITLKRKIKEELEIKNLQLLKNNEDLENILSIVSHDLKNPLYIIQDFAAILLQEYKETLSEDGLYYLERIKANAQHMEKLILDLLELSRVSRTKGNKQECAISDLVQRALEEFSQTIRNKGIEVRILNNFPICFCDSERIFQVFMNLLSNSIKFMQDTEYPMVEIGYLERLEEHEFFVKDNGIGIEKEYHEKIFVIFQRLQDVRDVEGTGVGLTIVRKIIEGHGGRVWVESKKGKGAAFYFTIPKKIFNSEVYLKINQTEKRSIP